MSPVHDISLKPILMLIPYFTPSTSPTPVGLLLSRCLAKNCVPAQSHKLADYTPCRLSATTCSTYSQPHPPPTALCRRDKKYLLKWNFTSFNRKQYIQKYKFHLHKLWFIDNSGQSVLVSPTETRLKNIRYYKQTNKNAFFTHGKTTDYNVP
jgi:hypothetical protein